MCGDEPYYSYEGAVYMVISPACAGMNREIRNWIGLQFY